MISFALPPGWVSLPVQDEERSQQAVRRIVDKLPLDDGTGARLRRELRDQLLAGVRSARERKAIILGMSGPAGGLISGSVLVIPLENRLPTDDLAWMDGLGASAVSFRLDHALGVRTVSYRQASTGQGLVAEAAESAAAEAAESTAAEAAESTAAEAAADDVQTLVVDFFLLGLNEFADRQVLVTFSTPLIDFEEQMIDLFNAVIESGAWTV